MAMHVNRHNIAQKVPMVISEFPELLPIIGINIHISISTVYKTIMIPGRTYKMWNIENIILLSKKI